MSEEAVRRHFEKKTGLRTAPGRDGLTMVIQAESTKQAVEAVSRWLRGTKYHAVVTDGEIDIYEKE